MNQPSSSTPSPLPTSGGSSGSPGGVTHDVEQNKVLAAIAYLPMISLILLLVKKDSPYVQFHAKQGFVLFIAWILLAFIPVFGMIASVIIGLFILAGFVSALMGQWRKLPGVSVLAEKINF